MTSPVDTCLPCTTYSVNPCDPYAARYSLTFSRELNQMSMAAATQSALPASIPRAVFNFGTQKYTAIQTAGPNEAVIGTTTITAGGQALQLNGGYASLATNGLVYKGGLIPAATTVSSSPSIVTGGRVVLTLASTTFTAVALSEGSIVGSETIGASDFEWKIGQQTLTPVSDGIVVASGTEKETYTYQLTNITQGVAAVTSTTLKSLETIPFPTTTKKSTSLKSLETIPFPSSTTAKKASSAIAATVTETTTVTATPSSDASRRGTNLACMAVIYLLVGLLAS